MATDEPVRVEQCDRDLAVKLYRRFYHGGTPYSREKLLAGLNDTDGLVRDLARHRHLGQADGRREVVSAQDADEAHRLACVLRIAQAYSNDHGEDMIRAAGMLDRFISSVPHRGPSGEERC